MREILVVNPRKRTGKKRAGGKVTKMAKKKEKSRRRTTRRRNPDPARRRPRRRNPSYARRASSRLTSGLSLKTALKDQVPIQIGMLAAQWFSKRFGPPASEFDPTTWGISSYLKGAVGSFAAAVAANLIKPGMGQKVLTGGLAHVTHRLVRNKLIEMSPTLINQFGDDGGLYMDDNGSPYVANAGQYLPLTEEHRMLPSGSAYGDSLVEAGGPLGQIEPVGPLGQSDSDFSRYAAATYR